MDVKKKPVIRFKGFTEDWEQRKLETLADIRTGYPFDSEDFDELGEYLVITNGNIQNESEKVNPSVGNHIDITDSNLLTTYLLNIDEMLENEECGLTSFGAGAIFEIWETEKITGDPKNSVYIRGE